MRNTKFIYGVLAVLLVITGWFAGSRQPVEAQNNMRAGEWRLFSASPALTLLYHTGTGEIRRVRPACGDWAPDGCYLDMPRGYRNQGEEP